MRNIYLFILLTVCTIFVFSNCKKKNTNTVTPIVDTPFIYGELTAFRQEEQDTFGAGYNIFEYAFADFWSDSITKTVASPGLITLNGDTLATPATENFHAYNFADSVNWNVGSGMFVSAFSCNLAGNFPGYTGSTLPDTIDATVGITVNITESTTNSADSIAFVFQTYHGSTPYVFIYRANPGAVYITLPNLSPSNYGVGALIITAFKTDYNVINGREYQFIRERRILKQVYMR
jgi:hypothetical protein